jgi:hypothetical protein
MPAPHRCREATHPRLTIGLRFRMQKRRRGAIESAPRKLNLPSQPQNSQGGTASADCRPRHHERGQPNRAFLGQKLTSTPPRNVRGAAGLWKRLFTPGPLVKLPAGIPGAPTPVGSLKMPYVA